MNKKLVRGSLAGVAAIALAAGGTTFAAWSDYGQINGNETAAGHLKLDLDHTGTISNVGVQAIAPNQFHTIDFMLASANLDGVPSADLSMKILHLADQENGCGSTNSEAAVDNCGTAGTPGEFSSEGYIRVRYTDPAPASDFTFANNQCTPSASVGGFIHSVDYTPANDNDATHYPRLGAFAAAGDHALGTLTSGDAVCVRVDMGLDKNATDAVQSDSSTFDVQFDLNQKLS
ncbi:MAG: SipW-dependent-type signal peptide-containing protein [Nocardioidaceae bacterium]